MTIKYIEKTSQAGTLCCAALGMIDFPVHLTAYFVSSILSTGGIKYSSLKPAYDSRAAFLLKNVCALISKAP